MFSAFRFGYFTYASSFGCWCYAYYFPAKRRAVLISSVTQEYKAAGIIKSRRLFS